MRTGSIRHPENSCFIRRHDWQIKALQKTVTGPKKDSIPECAAEIMSIMEYHYDNHLANRMLREVIERAMVKAGNQRNTLADLGDWMPYSVAYLKELLFNGRALKVIESALELLVERGFVTTNIPGDIQAMYVTNAKWYKLEVDVINIWIDKNITKTWVDSWKKPKKTTAPVEVEKPVSDQTRKENTIYNFYAHIHGKNGSFVFDSKRRSAVKARLKEKRSIGLCAAAILGNTVSDWHQGRHKDNLLENGGKVFDDIELIFRNAQHFEKHVGYAEDAGITEEQALAEFEAFLSGKPSRYAKKEKITAQKASQEQEAAIVEPSNASRYREFASGIAAFFTSNTSIAEIVEFCNTTPEFVKLGKGLINSEFMALSIDKATYTFRATGPTPDMVKAIRKFSAAFTQMQELNQGD